MAEIVNITSTGPYDLELSLKAMSAFSPEPPADTSVLRLPLRAGARAVVAEVRQVSRRPAVLEVSLPSRVGGARVGRQLAETVGWVLFLEQDLRPFYKLVKGHPVLGPLARRLYGLKASRPASLFDMAIIAVTEQQISLAAAYRIRTRLVEAYGDTVEGHTLYPAPEAMAEKSIDELKAFGLSRMKADYIIGLARGVVEGSVDLEALKGMPDEEAREYIISLKGFGPWAAEYIMVRGLGRADVVPADDLGIRTLVGQYLGDGARMSADEVRRVLEPFAPWRGLTAFYLLADHRLNLYPKNDQTVISLSPSPIRERAPRISRPARRPSGL
jgi:DNA-3-methyladenine glycosylase II